MRCSILLLFAAHAVVRRLVCLRKQQKNAYLVSWSLEIALLEVQLLINTINMEVLCPLWLKSGGAQAPCLPYISAPELDELVWVLC